MLLGDDAIGAVHAGTIGLAQGLETVLDAAELLHDCPEIRFVLVGDGLDLPRLQKLAAERKLDNVAFCGRHPAEDMPKFYALAAGLLVHLRDHPLFRITVPHKLFAYMAAGKPVLAAVHGDVAELVESEQAGLSCSPSRPAALAEMIRRFHLLSSTDRDAMGRNGRHAACLRYSREVLVGDLENMLASVAIA